MLYAEILADGKVDGHRRRSEEPTVQVLLDWVVNLISMMVIAGTRSEWRNVREDRSQ
jgi:hypothetical protein